MKERDGSLDGLLRFALNDELSDLLNKMGIRPRRVRRRRIRTQEEVDAVNAGVAKRSIGQPIAIREGKNKIFRGTIVGCIAERTHFHVIVDGPTGVRRGFNVKRVPTRR